MSVQSIGCEAGDHCNEVTSILGFALGFEDFRCALVDIGATHFYQILDQFSKKWLAPGTIS